MKNSPIQSAAEYEGEVWDGAPGFYIVNQVGVALERYDTREECLDRLREVADDMSE